MRIDRILAATAVTGVVVTAVVAGRGRVRFLPRLLLRRGSFGGGGLVGRCLAVGGGLGGAGARLAHALLGRGAGVGIGV